MKPTINDIMKSPCGKRNPHLEKSAPKKTFSKYGNKIIIVDGLKFHSNKEAKRWKELRLLEQAGEIEYLERQKVYELNPGGAFSYKYIADFVYSQPAAPYFRNYVVEDTKGFRTAEYKRKKRLMFKLYGIKIKET